MTAAILIAAFVQAGVVEHDTTAETRHAHDARLAQQAVIESVAVSPYRENLERLLDSDEDAAGVREELDEALQSLVEVNTASAEALRGVPGVSELTVRRILAFRERTGPLRSAADLMAAGLSPDEAAALVPFVSFDRSPRPSARVDVVQRWSRRLEPSRGFDADAGSSGYPGSPIAVQTRVKLRAGRRLSAGITADRDAGEAFMWSPRDGRFGPDFAAVHVGLDDVGPVERIVTGAFAVHAGEGLVLGHGSHGISRVQVAATDRLLRAHSSSREHGYFTGLALQSKSVAGLSMAAFASRKRVDGRVDARGSWHLAAPGYHRTRTERSGRALIAENVLGAVASLQRGSARLGVVFVRTGHALSDSLHAARAVSIFGGWIRPQWAATWEATPGLDRASLTATFVPIPSAALTVRIRRSGAGLPLAHTPIAGSSRAESLEMREVEADARFSPARAWTVSTHLRERRQADASPPLLARRFAYVRLEYRPHQWLAVHLLGASRSWEESSACRAAFHLLSCTERSNRRSVRLQVDYHHSRALRSRARVEMVEAGPDARGALLFEDLRWKPGPRFQVDARYVLFDANGSSARLYALENDVLYGFGAPSLSGRGRRWYVLGRLDPTRRMTIQMKYGETIYEDVMTIGSGLEEVRGNRIREIKLQIRWKTG